MCGPARHKREIARFRRFSGGTLLLNSRHPGASAAGMGNAEYRALIWGLHRRLVLLPLPTDQASHDDTDNKRKESAPQPT